MLQTTTTTTKQKVTTHEIAARDMAMVASSGIIMTIVIIIILGAARADSSHEGGYVTKLVGQSYATRIEIKASILGASRQCEAQRCSKRVCFYF